MARPFRTAPPLLAVALTVALVAGAVADDRGHGRHDHERARAALRAGEIAPLKDVLARAERDFAGSLLEVELERERGRWVYELKLLAPDGAVLEVYYDARTKELIGAKGHDSERALPDEQAEEENDD